MSGPLIESLAEEIRNLPDRRLRRWLARTPPQRLKQIVELIVESIPSHAHAVSYTDDLVDELAEHVEKIVVGSVRDEEQMAGTQPARFIDQILISVVFIIVRLIIEKWLAGQLIAQPAAGGRD